MTIYRKKDLKSGSVVVSSKKLPAADNKPLGNISELNWSFFENSIDAMMIGSQDGQIYAANRAACRMLGWNEKEISRIGRDGIVERNNELVHAINKRNTTGNFIGELIFIKRDGTRFPVEISSSTYKDSKGAELAIIIARDISKRKKTENALKESEARFRLASKATGFGSYSYNFKDGSAFYSDEFLLIYGLPPGSTIELDTDLVAIALHPDDKQQFLSAMNMANNPAGSGILDIEFRIIHTDGKIRWVRVRGLTTFSDTGSDAKPLHANGILQDITIRKQAEKSLAESTALLKSIMDSTTDLVWSVDPVRFELLTFNKALESFFRKEGIKIEKGVHLNEILPDGLVKKLSDLYTQALHQGSVMTEYATTLGNRILLINMNLLTRENKPYAISVFAKDITERKESELALKQAIDWQQNIFEGSLDAIFISDENSSLVAVNEAACQLTGYSKEHLLKMRIPDLHDKPDLKAYRKYHAKIITGEKIQSEAKILRPDGIKVDAEFNNSRISILGKYYMHTTARDITERKKIEEKIHSAALYARSLIEASLDPLVTINAEGKITDVNSSTEKITGFHRNKLIGSDFSDYFTNPDRARTGYKIAFSKGEVKDYPLTLRHKDGRTTYVLYNATLFKNESGEVQGVFAAARDITEQKKMESELLKSKQLLEKLNQHLVEVRENERNQIALNLHDDLGQRLTAINLDIAWLKSRIGVQSKPVREKIEEMTSVIKETIESIKETSNLLRPAILFDLGLISAIKSQLGNFEKQTGIKCNFIFRPEEFVFEDKISLILYRTFQESMTNIARHSRASTAYVNLYVLHNKVALIIKDDGIGIEKSEINSLNSMGIEGIKERVKSAGGKVTINGLHGSGTMISVEIPLQKVKNK
jgi:PAS domain S-box-containing protein